MIEVFYLAQLWFAVAAGLFALVLGLIGKLPSLWSVGSLAVVLLGLIGQLIYTTVIGLGGAQAAIDPVEF